jgi:hypothetical protein
LFTVAAWPPIRTGTTSRCRRRTMLRSCRPRATAVRSSVRPSP